MTRSAPARGRALRPLRQAHVGRPAPFRITGPAYAAALAGWVGAALLLLLAAPALANASVAGERAVAAAHLVGVVFFPFAVAAAVWQLLPVMLRTEPALPQARRAALVLIAAGAPLALGVAVDRSAVVGVSAALLGGGLLLLLAELASLVRRAPRAKVLVVSRPAVALAGLHAALAFALGAVELYPRRTWLVEAGVFAAGVQLLALGILAGADGAARSGAALLLCSTVLAASAAGESIRRVVTGRRGQPSSSSPSESA